MESVQYYKKFNIGDTVYLKTDIEQYKRIVTGYTVRCESIIYLVTLGEDENSHYDFEMSKKQDILTKITN